MTGKRRIIFLDIDGTLTQPGSNTPPASALLAIRQAREAGHLVFLCTGRNYDMLLPLLKYPFDGVIASSGGYVLCGNEVIYDHPMPPEKLSQAMEILQKNGIYRTVECVDGSYTDEGFKEFLKRHADQGQNSEMLRWREQIEASLRIRPMAEYKGQPVYKIVMMAESRKQLEEPQRVLADSFTFIIPQNGKYGYINAELISCGFNKGTAVRQVSAYYSIPPEDTIGFGDSINDREMLETTGLSICMENGSEEAKKIADEICPSVTENGLYQAFNAHGLLKKTTT